MTAPPTHSAAPPPWALAFVLGAIVSVQFGGAVAATLIPVIGAMGAVALRLSLGALLLLAVLRPRIRGYRADQWREVLAFGVALALMNSTFYLALARLPIGVAVTLEFVGPLVLAAFTSRSRRDIVAVVLAGLGVTLVSGLWGISGLWGTSWAQLDLFGMAMALTAGAAWAAYIVFSARAGRHFPGADSVAWAMVVATVLVAPAGFAMAGTSVAQPSVVALGLGIALLSSALPYSLENLALRHIPTHVFGVLLSLEPAVAALAGVLVLGQLLTGGQLAGMGLVVLASILIRARHRRPARHGPQ